MAEGFFTPTLKYIQIAASYRITFKLKNKLLGQKATGGITRTSGFMVVFPSNMPHNTESMDPTINSLDARLIAAKILVDKTYQDLKTGIDCTKGYACYKVTYENTKDI